MRKIQIFKILRFAINYLHYSWWMRTSTYLISGPQAFLIFGSESTIYSLTLPPTHYADVASNIEGPIAIGHDLYHGYVYWSDIINEKIERASFVYTGDVETVVEKVKYANGTLFYECEMSVTVSNVLQSVPEQKLFLVCACDCWS